MNENIKNADIAFNNKQYDVALAYYQKALVSEPNNLYALTRAGTICVAIENFDEALKMFGRARQLDPYNGDVYFNYGNALFFNKKYGEALEAFCKADQLKCSENIKPRLYYQMAMLCCINQDYSSALTYFKKAEDVDTTGYISLSENMLSEKLKIFMLAEDLDNSANTACKLVAIKPSVYKYYMVYFSILVGKGDLAAAEKVLSDAEKYAEMSTQERFALNIEQASLYIRIAENSPNSIEYSQKAIDILEKLNSVDSLTTEQKLQIKLSLSDVFLKCGKYNELISSLAGIVNEAQCVPLQNTEHLDEADSDIEEDTDDKLQNDMDAIQKKIDSGELDENLGDNSETEAFDDEGTLIHVYEESILSFLNKSAKPEKSESKEKTTLYIPKEIRDQIAFTLLKCYMERADEPERTSAESMEDYKKANNLANLLKRSTNKYYSYFGIYTDALTERKLNSNMNTAEQKYAEAIAFFRNRAFEKPGDAVASIFRARLYAEEGKYEKALEVAKMLADSDSKQIVQYVESLKASN